MSRVSQGLAILSALILIVVAKYGMRFMFAEWSVESSKTSGWSADFRTGFLEVCTDEAMKSIANSMKLDLKDDSDKGAAHTIAHGYCDCMASDVEKNKILLTKFNQYRGIAKAEAANEQAISDYMSSNDGMKAINGCMEKAVAD